MKYFLLCFALFFGVLGVFHNVEKNLERAHSEYQQRLDSLSRRKREYGAGNVTNKLNSDSSSISKSPTMRKLQFFQSGNAVQMPHVESFQQVGCFYAVFRGVPNMNATIF